MEDNNAITEQPNAIDYEVAFNQMKETAQNLFERVKQLENTWMLNRASILFKIIDCDKFDENTKKKAVDEITQFVYPVEKEEQKKEE